MSKLSSIERSRLEALVRPDDDDIDLSDIPEITYIPPGTVRGRFYRPVKKSVTIRLDADVVEWMKSSGDGYQTRINAYLRDLMRTTR
jgi:uncharacterized protein (DUF4415 family)